MSKCEHLSKKSGEICGKLCTDTLKKPRCEKHRGEDIKIIETKDCIIPKELNPHKPASKEWIEWNKKMKKKSKKDTTEIVEDNPFIQISENIKLAIISLKKYKPSIDYCSLCVNNGKYLLKGTPVYYVDNSVYYVANDSFKIDMFVTKNYKGWGTTELEVVREEADIDFKTSNSQKFSINQFVIERQHIYDKTPESLSSFTFRKYMKEINNKHYLFHIPDISTRETEREKLLELSGAYEHIKYSDNFRRLDVDSAEKWSITIKMNHLSNVDLQKTIDKKLSMREIYGDDYMYREFLYKRYSVKKIGGPEYEEAKEHSF